MRSGMLGRFMEEVLTLSPMPDKPLPRLLRKLSRPVPEPLAAARSAPDTRMEVLLRYGARPVEREIHRIQVAAGRRRRNSRPNPPPGKAGRERTKTTTIQENLLPYFGFKNKELYLHRKTTQGIRYLVRIGKK